MEAFNIYDGELHEDSDGPAGACRRRHRFGGRIGASQLGMTVYELQPGEFICPYHYEYPREEWLLVLMGTPTLRDPDGEHELEAGDVVCFLPGPGGAHKVINRSAEPMRVVMLSTTDDPSVAVYPDSDKIGIWPGNDHDHIIVRRSSGVDYWEGEEVG